MATVSIVDYLKSQGKDSSFSARQKLAQQYGISNYSGTSAQNLSLLDKLQSSSSPQPTPQQSYSQPSYQQPQYSQSIQESQQYQPAPSFQPAPEISQPVYQPAPQPVQYQQPQTSQPANDFQNYSDLPDNIKNSSSWQSLSNDQRALAYFTYKTQSATTDAQKIDAQKALEQAKNLADPYFKEQIRLAQDEINRSISSVKSDAQSKVNQLQTRIQQIQEDLSFNKNNLSLDQQAELASQIRKNEEDLFNLQQNMAEAGLAFSSPRQKAEQNLAAEQQGIAESTQRKYNNQKFLAEQDAARNTAALNANLADVERQKQEQLTSIARKGEQQLGSANFTGVEGIQSMGNVTGDLPTQNQSQVLDLQNKLINRGNPFSF